MYNRAQIEKMITENQKALERGVIAIYERQTINEQATKNTEEHNGVGFNSSDAGYLSYVAQYIIARRDHIEIGKILSGQHLTKTTRRMAKYCGQLTKIANKEM